MARIVIFNVKYGERVGRKLTQQNLMFFCNFVVGLGRLVLEGYRKTQL